MTKNDNHNLERNGRSHDTDDLKESSDLLHIDSIVAGGDGMARRSDGCVVFVPRTAPGERVEVEYLATQRQWRRARLLRLHEASPDRRDPPCPHYAQCGGCQLQHLDYRCAQIPAKSAIVADALRRIGKMDLIPPEVAVSDHELGYRNRVSFVLKRKPNRVVAGYHNVFDASVTVDVDRCLLAEEPINAVWNGLRSAWDLTSAALPPRRELRMTFRATDDGEVGLAIEGSREPGRPDRLLEITDGLAAVWVLNPRGDVVGHAGRPSLDERVGQHVIPLAGTAFLQVNRTVAALLDGYVLQQCGQVRGKRVIDAYCGFGLRALELAQRGASAIGIERDRYAITTAVHLAERSSTPCRFVTGDVERVLKRFVPADVVILNPPRRGVDRRVIDILSQREVDRIVYVSCDPATLARDLRRLSDRFKLDTLQGFDLFPQTAHVETVATLKRSESV
ncbi:MAG: class I SAM-dependent RNA methyltransferase [Candidatus Latescibacterota bacterium]|nr:MAG: class I SAM-dependent RNA methyltransferase [Candidatus Latescibacterota bacterium]